MDEPIAYQPDELAARDRARTVFAQTMGYVAGTAALFALGAYLGRDVAGGVQMLVGERDNLTPLAS